ncbi:MAG: GDP-mannose 4,6-dehydratase [Thermoanaerobaculia bacterium]
MSLQGRKVLVTGAGGFIGSHLVERLVETGASVRAFVHYNALGSWGWLDETSVRGQFETLAGDIADRDSVRRAVSGTEIVFHLAALIGIPYSYDAPLSYVRTNVEGTLNVLMAAREGSVARVVHTSTSEAYGTARSVPMTESHPLQAQSPYAATKIAADKLAESFYLSFGVPVVTVRPFNTFGPRQSNRAVIPTVISQALAGDRIRLGNLAPTRDFNFVANTVDGFLRAAATPRAEGETVNLGSGREVSIRDLVEMVGSILGKRLEVEEQEARQRVAGSEVERLIADGTRAREVLDWTPAVSLEEGLERTVAWISRNRERYRTHAYTI